MYVVWLLILILALTGCGKKTRPAAETAGGEKAASAPHLQPDMSQAAPAAGNVVKGSVAERVDASSYSYLRLKTASGEVWAAVPQTALAVGTEVAIVNSVQMEGFESATLHRKFDKIIFGTIGQDQGAAQPVAEPRAAQPIASHGGSASPPPEVMGAMRQQHAGVTNSVSSEPIQVEKAPGADGRTIAQIFEQKPKLKDQQVAVRGKVVKVNSNIMGKTWIHLHDGTGSRDANTDDLTVTTLDSAAVGDIVLVKGRIHTDKDFGMGYNFSVIIEDATVTK
jgi:hypothetical protein